MGTKLKYCRQCGNVYLDDDIHSQCEDCTKYAPKFKLFSSKEEKEKRLKYFEKIKLITIENIYLEDLKKPDEPYNHWGLTPSVYEYVWDNYVNVPSNKYRSKLFFDDEKREIMAFLNNGGVIGAVAARNKAAREPVSCPKCGSKSITTQNKFGTGKAVAGAVIAGTAGAVIGGAGGSKVINVCQNCGHKWEPGK